MSYVVSWKHGQVNALRKSINNDQDIRFIPTLITEFHASPLGGHMGVTKTLARMKDNFTSKTQTKCFPLFPLGKISCFYTQLRAC